MDVNKIWPLALEDHDAWLDVEPFTMVYVARHQMRGQSLSCKSTGPWTFLNIWTTKELAITQLNKGGEGPDDYFLIEVPLAELCSVYRAIALDGKPMLLTGSTISFTMSSTYLPNNHLFSCPSSIWLYAVDKNGNDVTSMDEALVISLTVVGLLVELQDIIPDFDADFAKGLYEIKAIPFIGLVSKARYVYTDRDTHDMKKALALSKASRTSIMEKDNV